MDYATHYLEARRIHAELEGAPHPVTPAPLYGLGVSVIPPDGAAGDAPFPVPPEWPAMVAAVREAVAPLWSRPEALFDPPGRPGDEPPLTIAVRDPFAVAGVAGLAESLVPALEDRVLGCYAHVERCGLYRSLVSTAAPHVSFLWHYDNHPREIFKVIVYLTDVSEETGPFEYLRHPRTGLPRIIAPTRTGPDRWEEPVWPWARVPREEIDRLAAEGYEPTPVTGRAGTVLLFTQNCIHRARVARRAPRDVLLLQVRPASLKLRPPLHRAWTGTGEHAPVVPDPTVIEPLPKGAVPEYRPRPAPEAARRAPAPPAPARVPDVRSAAELPRPPAAAPAPEVFRPAAPAGLAPPPEPASPPSPFLLDDMNPAMADALFDHLASGLAGAWVGRVRPLGRHAATFQEAAEAWVAGLLGELAAADDAQADVAALLARVFARDREVSAIRAVYRSDAARAAFAFWPTLESGGAFTANLCPRKDRFITKDTRIASMGSCFAMNVARALARWGFRHFVTEEAPPHLAPEEAALKGYGLFSARYGTIFNTPSMRQLVERGFGLFAPRPFLYRYAGSGPKHGRWLDPYREEVCFDSPEEALASRAPFEEALRRTLTESEVFIITLGVNETWRFLTDGSTISRVPWGTAPALLERRVLTADENVAELERMLGLWRRHNPGLRLIVTVSPVPLLATYRDDAHVMVANAHSKAVLRVAAEAFAARNEGVTYFPAYEAVLHGTRNPFVADGRHVSEEAIARVMGLFRDTFLAV